MSTLTQKADELKTAVQTLANFDKAISTVIADYPLPYKLSVTSQAELIPAIRRHLLGTIATIGEAIAKESKL